MNPDGIKTGVVPLLREGHGRNLLNLLAMRCPVYRRRESIPGFRTELENLAGDGKGKGASGCSARPKIPMRRLRGGLLRSSVKRGNACRAKGAGHSRRNR